MLGKCGGTGAVPSSIPGWDGGCPSSVTQRGVGRVLGPAGREQELLFPALRCRRGQRRSASDLRSRFQSGWRCLRGFAVVFDGAERPVGTSEGRTPS